MIDWQRVVLHLGQRRALSRIGKRVGASRETLSRIKCGHSHREPPFSVGLKLLDLHLRYCPDQHKPDVIGEP